MNHPGLRGRSILVVEDELLIAMDIVAALEKAGAHATMITSVRHALILVEHDSLSGAIMIIRSATATATICALA